MKTESLNKVLMFFKIIDEHDTKSISLTNMLVIVLITKIALTVSLNFVDVAGLFTVIASYNYKRYLNSAKAKAISDEDKATQQELLNRITKLENCNTFKNIAKRD